MKKFLIPLVAFFSIPFSSVESVEINCKSPVFKNKPQCAHLKNKKTFIYENIEYALEEGCKEEAAKISSDGWWYVFFITTVFNMGMITLGRHFGDKKNYY